MTILLYLALVILLGALVAVWLAGPSTQRTSRNLDYYFGVLLLLAGPAGWFLLVLLSGVAFVSERASLHFDERLMNNG